MAAGNCSTRRRVRAGGWRDEIRSLKRLPSVNSWLGMPICLHKRAAQSRPSREFHFESGDFISFSFSFSFVTFGKNKIRTRVCARIYFSFILPFNADEKQHREKKKKKRSSFFFFFFLNNIKAEECILKLHVRLPYWA